MPTPRTAIETGSGTGAPVVPGPQVGQMTDGPPLAKNELPLVQNECVAASGAALVNTLVSLAQVPLVLWIVKLALLTASDAPLGLSV